MITELIAVVGSNDDQSVLPVTTFAKFCKHSTHVMINFTDHAVILRTHLAQTRLGFRRGCAHVVHCSLVKWMASFTRCDW